MEIIPAILERDLDAWRVAYERLAPCARRLQVDVADGKFVSQKTLGLESALTLIEESQSEFELHALVTGVEGVVRKIAQHKDNLRRLIIHFEALGKADAKVWANWCARLAPVGLGLGINPETSPGELRPLLGVCDFVTIMTVAPGKQSNPFIPASLSKIEKLRQLGFKGKIEVDGGVNLQTIGQITPYRPDYLVVGSALVRAVNPQAVYKQMKSLLE